MPLTFIPLATSTLSSTATQLNFTSISGSYTDLFMVVNWKSASNNIDYPTFWVGAGNSIDTGSNYSANHFEAGSTGVAVYSYDNATNTTLPYGQAIDSPNYAYMSVWLMDYSATNKYKTMIADYRTDKVNWQSGVGTATWRNTAAINCIRIGQSGSFDMAAGTFATIWGVLKA